MVLIKSGSCFTSDFDKKFAAPAAKDLEIISASDEPVNIRRDQKTEPIF